MRPLTVSELIEAHAVELSEDPPYLDREGRSYEQDDLFNICLGLIEIAYIENENKVIVSVARIAHFSIKEYLQSDRIRQQKAEKFAIDSGSANAELSQICLVYLLDPILSDGDMDEAKRQAFPLTHFAAVHWFDHYQSSRADPESERLLLRLFKNENNSFVIWARIYEIDRTWAPRYFCERYVDSVTSPIYYASYLGLENILRAILDMYEERRSLLDFINRPFGVHHNALQAASHEGHKRIVQMLLDHGAKINVEGEAAGGALYDASSNGHYQVVQILLKHGAKVNANRGDSGTALIPASAGGHNQVVQMLLDHGADVNASGSQYSNAMAAASHYGRDQVVQILLDHGAYVNDPNAYGNPPLTEASEFGHEAIVRILLDHGADVNASGSQLHYDFYATSDPDPYCKPIIKASRNGHETIVRMLLDHGADVNDPNTYSNPLTEASRNGREAIVRILLDHGADVNGPKKSGEPLIEASHYGRD
ncbi:hypothetical protein N7481_005162 [Penicillium waksmanii]|uniref:uncharacterized protein n=1 Tax=Penicillium waksmanii TaxID=69791 RepID=UPI00254749B3|nr:uncharacterized protein N7481_005162 [Penicillium waksmanii]KAJ5983063.1 hypothetical protein N7481_005162 [Penicillium waksmanii]